METLTLAIEHDPNLATETFIAEHVSELEGIFGVHIGGIPNAPTWPEDVYERTLFRDWQCEVANRDTILGFRDWLAAREADLPGEGS